MQAHTLPARDKLKYCGFHQDYDHTTENCIQLKIAIERLIRDGHLKEYISGMQQKDKPERIIEVIIPQFLLIKEIKRKIYNLSKLNPIPNLDVHHHESVTFSKNDLMLNKEARVTPIVLNVGIT